MGVPGIIQLLLFFRRWKWTGLLEDGGETIRHGTFLHGISR